MLAAADARLRATADPNVAPVSDDEEDSLIQDNLQSELIGSYYDVINERKRRASIEMEASFANELEMFRRHDAAVVVQCGWRCHQSRATLASKRAWAKVAEAGGIIGNLTLQYIRMKEHRVEFLHHRRRVAASVVIQRTCRGRLGRRIYDALLLAKKAREHEIYRQKLHAEAAHAVNTLNTAYRQVDIEQIATSTYRSDAAADDLQPEPEFEDARPLSQAAPAEGGTLKLTPTPPVANRRRKHGGRPVGLCTGRARQRAGSVEATMAFEGTLEAQRTSLVVRPNVFQAAGQKIQSMIKVSNLFSSGLARSGGAGALAKVESGAVQAGIAPRTKPPKKGRKIRASARNYAKTKPRYLQHLEPKPPPVDRAPLSTSERRPGSDRNRLPPLAKTTRRENGKMQLPSSVRAAHTARTQPSQLSPLRVKAR